VQAGGWAEEEDAEAGERSEGVRRERRREGRASKRAEGRGDERRTRKRRRWIWGEWIRGGGGEWIGGGGEAGWAVLNGLLSKVRPISFLFSFFF